MRRGDRHNCLRRTTNQSPIVHISETTKYIPYTPRQETRTRCTNAQDLFKIRRTSNASFNTKMDTIHQHHSTKYNTINMQPAYPCAGSGRRTPSYRANLRPLQAVPLYTDQEPVLHQHLKHLKRLAHASLRSILHDTDIHNAPLRLRSVGIHNTSPYHPNERPTHAARRLQSIIAAVNCMGVD